MRVSTRLGLGKDPQLGRDAQSAGTTVSGSILSGLHDPYARV